MKFVRLILCASALAAPMSAHALTGSLGALASPILTLDPLTGLAGGTVAGVSGGTVYSSDQSFADIPFGTVGNFLAAGPSSGTSATLTFAPGITALSFLWGSPDLYNWLTVTTNLATASYTTTSLGFPLSNGDQSFAQAVKFTTGANEYITSINFTNTTYTDAFEVSNFRVIQSVPEPTTWAMMIGGLALVGATMRRRVTAVSFA